jgi:alpha-tubulin suppressor-like RCC1 family protein
VGAVVLNVTVTEPSGMSFVTVFPGGQARPLASSLNVVAGQTVANAVVVKPGADGTVALYNDRGSAHVVVDVAGWMPPGATVVDVGVGGSHSLALRSDGSVFAWGDNHAGQLGDGGATLGTSVPQQVVGLGPGSRVSAVSAGDSNNLALIADGAVLAWGGNYYGQLGNGSNALTSDIPVQVSGLGPGSGVVQVSTAGATGLALKRDGTVLAWGDNSVGQLGNNSDQASAGTPVQVTGLGPGSGVVAISAGPTHALALKDDGTVLAWGDNRNGELGNDTFLAMSKVPVIAKGMGAGSGVIAVSSGAHNLAMMLDGRLWSWGSNAGGALGAGLSGSNAHAPVFGLGMGAPSGAARVEVGRAFTLVVRSDGSLSGWGVNDVGQLTGSSGTHPFATQLTGFGPGGGPIVVSAGYGHSLAIDEDGFVKAWGHSFYGALGNGPDGDPFQRTPALVVAL